MTVMRDAIDTTTLGWIKPELDETMRHAREAIEAFAESPGDASRMKECAAHLHQVHGTLRMVELYAPAMVAEEMERLSLALMRGDVADRDEACAVLMRGAVQLPDYLERLQGGHRDIPIVLLPLLNELRATRGELGLNESVLFSPDLDRPLPESVPAPNTALPSSQAGRPQLGALREQLARWPEDGAPADAGQLVRAVEGLLADVVVEPLRRMLWVASSVAQALRDGALQPTRSLRQAFAGVEREARLMLEGDGFSGPRDEAAAEPTRQLLYHVAHHGAAHPALDDLRSTFDLNTQRPSESEIEHARGSLSGRNRALLDTVSAAIKEDLMRVKDALDLHLRTGKTDISELRPQVEALGRVSDTLGMMGLGVARSVVQQQRDAMHEIVSGQRAADESALLDVAGALLYVDASLDDQVSRLGMAENPSDEDLVAGEAQRVLEVVAREAIANFGDARQAFVAFVETNWDHAELVDVPRLLEEVGGALRMLDLAQPADYLQAIRAYTQAELLGRRRVPNGQQLDTLADALASVEYYLEALREQRPNRERILDIARLSLETLGYWPIPSGALEPASAFTDLAIPEPALNLTDATPVAMVMPAARTPSAPVSEDAVVASTPVAPAVPGAPAPPGGAGGFEHSDDIDDDIREVFLEELSEEIGNLDALLPAWRAMPEDGEQLRPIRRVFHTLKGSGRLVGAKTLGEFSWKIENMLNRVLDGTRPATPPVIDLVGRAHATLPQLYAALAGTGAITADLAGMEAHADLLASGEEAFYVEREPAAAPAPVESASVGATEPEPVVEAAAIEVEPVAEVAAVEPSVPASVDAVLLEILGIEVDGHLATIRNWLAAQTPDRTTADDVLQRAIHTLNGAFAMTEVPVITAITGPTEVYVKRLLAARLAPTEQGVAVMGEVADAIQRTMASLQTETPRVPLFEGLAERMAQLRDSLPEAHLPLVDEELEIELETIDAPGADAVAPVVAMDLSEFLSEDASTEIEALEAERLEAERLEAERLEAERLEAERVEAERLEVERLEAERVEAERLEVERLEAERLEAERLEAERLEVERLEAKRLEVERLEAERLEGERLEAERLEVERVEAERLEAERLEAERLEAERLEAERLEAERREAVRLEAERLEAERLEFEELDRLTAPEAVAEAGLEVAETADATVAEFAESEIAPEPAIPTTPATELEPHPVVAAVLSNALTDNVDPDEALDLTDLDPELVDIFVEEGVDLLDHSDRLLAQLRETPTDRETLAGLQRDLHTLKGGARMAGIMAVGDLGHVMESLLEAVVENRRELGREGVPLLERGFDRLHTMITRVGERHAVAIPQALIAEFEARARGEEPVFAAAALAPAPVAVEVAAEAVASANDGAIEVPEHVSTELKPLSAPLIEAATADDDDIGIRAPQEQVRIRADLLDRLVNYAGEVAIYRARLEQQLGAFRSAIAEMEQTNLRVRDQLRRLEIETEAQIVARYQREETVDATFDPLELDRFSTLQQLSRALAESAADQTSLQGTLDDLTRQYETLLLQQSRVSSELQEGLMRTRMVPFDGLLPRLRRVVRQASGELGKQVQLKLEGTHGELDRNVLERMTAPLEHMLRNSVAHGLEKAEDRRKAGKAEEGAIRIALHREGSEVVIAVSDDGRGLDRAAIRRRGEERGLVRPDAVLSDAVLDQLILEPGFSTATEVSKLAGRGVGMDVVASEVRQLGGTLDIHSVPGQGTHFTLRLPQTLAVTQAVFVKIGETTFAVPIASVRGVGRIAREQLGNADVTYRYGGEDYALHDLGELVGHAPAKAEGHLQMPLLLIRAGDLRAAVTIDQIVGNREIVVKPVGPQVASIPGIFGATIMGDGSVVVILDVAPLVRRQAALPRDIETVVPVIEHRRVPLVMVVDDSITMRKVTGRVLERANFEVATAKDGLDALERMAEFVPDLMLLDIEMPRMDGYELATAMKADPRLRNVPIIMITSRTGEKHRERAFEIGVNRYLGKPYQEPELLRNVHELLGVLPRHEQ